MQYFNFSRLINNELSYISDPDYRLSLEKSLKTVYILMKHPMGCSLIKFVFMYPT